MIFIYLQVGSAFDRSIDRSYTQETGYTYIVAFDRVRKCRGTTVRSHRLSIERKHAEAHTMEKDLEYFARLLFFLFNENSKPRILRIINLLKQLLCQRTILFRMPSKSSL